MLQVEGKTENRDKDLRALTRDESARMLRVTVRTVDRAIRRGELKVRRFRGRVLVPIAEVERYLRDSQGRNDGDAAP